MIEQPDADWASYIGKRFSGGSTGAHCWDIDYSKARLITFLDGRI